MESAGKEEVLGSLDPSAIHSARPLGDGSPVAGTASLRSAFAYKVNPKIVQVGKFKWKRTDGPEALSGYIAELRQLLAELEALT